MPPSVVLEVEFKPNVVVDFNQLAEKKYGFEAMHPTVSTADDLLVDDDGDDNEEGENDEEEDREDLPQLQAQKGQQMSTTAGTAVPSAQPSKKRRRKVGNYDLHDPFIDDAEMEWESTAAATKDGFFVYSGVFENEDTEPSSEKDGKKSAKRKKESDNSATSKRRKQVKKKAKPEASPSALREIKLKEDSKKSSGAEPKEFTASSEAKEPPSHLPKEPVTVLPKILLKPPQTEPLKDSSKGALELPKYPEIQIKENGEDNKKTKE